MLKPLDKKMGRMTEREREKEGGGTRGGEQEKEQEAVLKEPEEGEW